MLIYKSFFFLIQFTFFKKTDREPLFIAARSTTVICPILVLLLLLLFGSFLFRFYTFIILRHARRVEAPIQTYGLCIEWNMRSYYKVNETQAK